MISDLIVSGIVLNTTQHTMEYHPDSISPLSSLNYIDEKSEISIISQGVVVSPASVRRILELTFQQLSASRVMGG